MTIYNDLQVETCCYACVKLLSFCLASGPLHHSGLIDEHYNIISSYMSWWRSGSVLDSE